MDKFNDNKLVVTPILQLLVKLACLSPLVANASSSSAAFVEFRRPEIVRKSIVMDSGCTVALEIEVDRPRPLPSSDDLTGELHFGHVSNDELAFRVIRVKWGKLPQRVLALSAYLDMYSPNEMTITPKGDEVELAVEGGDASTSYKATLRLAAHGMVSRTAEKSVGGYREVTEYVRDKRSAANLQKLSGCKAN
jgi:hypothetical protein